MTPDERNAIISGSPLKEGATVDQYKRWAMNMTEKGPETVDKIKRRLMSSGGWSQQQADTLFDIPILKTEFINTKKTEVKALDDETSIINAGLKIANEQMRGLSRQKNPYGFDTAAQEIESRRTELKDRKDALLDQRAAIGEQLVSQANNFGKDDETAHLIRQNVAQAMNLIEGSSAYTAKPNGVYKNGQLVSPTLWNEVIANSEEYGTYLGVGVAATATDRAISKARGKQLTKDTPSPKNASRTTKALRYGTKVLKFAGPLAAILGESYLAAEAGATQRADNRQKLANIMDVTISEDWQKQRIRQDVKEQFTTDAMLTGALGAAGVGIVAGRVLYGMFGKGDVVTSDAFISIRNQTGLSNIELTNIRDNFRKVHGNIDVTLTNRLFPTRVLHSVKRPEALATKKKVKFDKLSEPEQIVASLYLSGNPRYQHVIENAVENRPHIQREAALNNAIEVSKKVKESTDKFEIAESPHMWVRTIKDASNEIKGDLDTFYGDKSLNLPGYEIQELTKKWKGGDVSSYIGAELSKLTRGPVAGGDPLTVINPRDLAAVYSKVVGKFDSDRSPHTQKVIGEFKDFITQKFNGAGIGDSAEMTVDMLDTSARFDRALSTSLGKVLAKPNLTKQEAYDTLVQYHRNTHTELDYEDFILNLNRSNNENLESVEQGLVAFAVENHTIRKTNYPDSPYVVDFNSLVRDLQGFKSKSGSQEVENSLNLIRGLGKVYENNAGLMAQHHRSLNVDPKTGVYLATTLEGRKDMYITNILTRGIAGFIPLTDAHRTYQLQRAVLTFLDSGGVDTRSSNEIIEMMSKGELQ